MPILRSIPLVAIVVICGFASENSLAAAEVTVKLASGRIFTGEVSPSSSGDHLVLTFGGGNTQIERPIEWNRVVSIRSGDKDISPQEMQRSAAAKNPHDPSPARGPVTIQGSATWRKPVAKNPSDPFLDENNLRAVRPVKSLAIDAALGHWEAGTEPSGFELRIMPLDGRGQLTPASGTLEIEWLGPQRRDFNAAPQSHGVTLERLGSWTTTIAAADLGSDGFVYQAPFQTAHPEFDANLYSRGLVRVRLNVPGEGTFEAAVDGVRVRPYSPTRDRLEQATGGRFFPNELTTRGKSYPGPFASP